MKFERLIRSIFVLLLIASLCFSPAADAAAIADPLALELEVAWVAFPGIPEKS